MSRRAIVSVVGSANVSEGSEPYDAARELGRLLVDDGHRVMTGGLGGVMEAACRGAHESTRYREGDTVGVLPQADPAYANDYVDIVLPTGLDHARNAIVANADAVIVVDGGAGTLSEIAFAWVYKRLIVALDVGGWGTELAGKKLDRRRRSALPEEDCVFGARSPAAAVEIVRTRLPAYVERHRGISVRRGEG